MYGPPGLPVARLMPRQALEDCYIGTTRPVAMHFEVFDHLRQRPGVVTNIELSCTCRKSVSNRRALASLVGC